MAMAKSLILISLFASIFAVPVDRANDKCATECSGTSSKFQYEVGKSYNYQFETESKVKIAGTSQNEASVKIEANAQISVIQPCEFSLKLSQVKITGPTTADLGSDWTQELQKYVTRFSFDDGEIGEICPKDDEPTWSVNIKRAILSAFQNAQAGRSDTFDSYEEDISGRCPTTFEVQEQGDTKTITKRKRLNSCFNRLGNNTALRIIPYEVRSTMQSTPMINATQTCKQTIRRGLLSEVLCEEKHILKAHSNKDKGGIMAISTSKLHFTNENGNVARGEAGHAEKLYFDHKEIEHVESKQALGDARQNLKDLCKTSKDEVRPETPGYFNELIYNLRKLSLVDLKTLYQESTTSSECETAKQSLFNALPMCSNAACVSLVADILKSDIAKLTTVQKRVYFSSFALIPHVTKEMVVAVTPLVGSVPEEGLLGISTLVHTYCRENPQCGDQTEVKSVVQKLATLLGAQCATKNNDERDKVIYALRALGNVGHSSESVDKRVNCLKEKKNAIDVRLAAVQSLRRTPCAVRVTPLKERFADIEEDVEVRITSFLTFIPCIAENPEIVTSVKEILENEQIHQVGSFVRTYFEQIGSTADPAKQQIQNLLSSQYISKRFNSDPRKYSRFFETSQFSSKVNFGGHAESGLIFTPDGYLPKQAFLNLTLDAFGSSMNLLEIGGRAEGTEKLLDDLFGPNGYFTNPTGFYFKPSKKQHKNPKVVELQDKFGKTIKKTPNLDASFYARIFGDEVAYKSFRDINLMDRYTKTMEKVMSSLKASQEANIKLARANQLINHYFSFPTISGLPFHVGLNLTIALNVEFSGKLDLSKLMREKNAELRASLKPSAAIERGSVYAIHVGHSKFGVRVQETTHSSTAANIVVELKNGEVFKSSLELPKQKNEILQYDYKLFTIKNNVPTEEPGITKDRISGVLCSPERLNKWIGFKVCHEASFANATSVPDAPYFPLTGPVHYALTLEKTDPNLKSYEFSATWKNTPGAKTAKLSFNTPGSSVDREVSIDYNYQRGKSLALNFRSPLKKIDAVGTLEVSGKKQNGKINIKVDDSKEYTLTGSQEKDTPNSDNNLIGKTIWKGEILRPGQPPVTISATDELLWPQSGLFKSSLDLKVENLFETPLELKFGSERTAPRQGTLNFDLKSPKLNSKIAGKVTLEGNIRNGLMLREGVSKSDFDWTLEFQRPKDPASQLHKVELKYSLDYARQGPNLKIAELIKSKCNQHPHLSFDYKLDVDKKSDQLDVKCQFSFAKGDVALDVSSKRSADNKHTGTASLKSAALSLDHKADFTYQNNLPKQFLATAKVDTPQTKNINLEAKFTRNPGQSVEGEGKMNYPGRDLRIYKKIQRVDQSGKYKSQTVVQWQKDKQIELDSDITFNTQANDYEFKTVATGIDGQTWTFNKKVKIGEDLSVKSAALLQKGSQTVYDWNLDVTKEGAKKQKLQAKLRSDYGQYKIDISADGLVEDLGSGKKLTFTSKKDQKDFLKGELIVPKTYEFRNPESQKQVKVDLVWDKNSILVDYQRTKPKPDQIQIEGIVKFDLAQYQPAINRKLNVKISTSDVKMVNLTWFKDNNLILDGSFGLVAKSNPTRENIRFPTLKRFFGEGAVDVTLKTFEPWTKRHITALAAHKLDDNNLDFSLKTDNLQEKRKFGIRFGLIKDGQKRTVQTEHYYNDRSLKTKHIYERVEAEMLRKLIGEIEYNEGSENRQRRAAADKKITHEWSVKTGPSTRLTSKLETPFAQLSDFDGTIEISRQGKAYQKNIDLKWNQNQNLKLNVKGDVSADYTNVEGKLQSTLAGLKNGQFTLRTDIRTGRDFETKLEWNDVNKLRSYHQRTSQPSGDEKWSTGVEATVPNTMNYKASANIDWNKKTGKYKANTESQLNGGGAYKIQADFDTTKKEGTIDVATPTVQLKSAKAQVTKLNENEYELKMVQNADTVADVKAVLKLEDNKQKVVIEVKNIDKPFKTQLEHEWSPTRFLLGGELNVDLNDPKKTYGIKIVRDQPKESSRDVQLSLSYPGRQLKFRNQRVHEVAPQHKFDWTTEIQTNSDQPETKVQIHYLHPTPDQGKFELHITKGQDSGLRVEVNADRKGNCKLGELAQCQISGDVAIKYSPDASKAVTHKFKLNRDIVEQRRKYSYEWQWQHPVTSIQVKSYGTVLLSDCMARTTDCKRVLESGLEIMDKKKQNQVFKYKFETDSKQSASSEWTCPNGSWKKVFVYDGDEVKILVQRDNKDVYELTAGFDRPDKEYKIEIKDAATNEVVIHAGARRPSADSVELKLWHSQNKQKVEDISVIASLRDDSRVRSRLFVRPGLRNDYGEYLKKQWERAQAFSRSAAYNESAIAQLIQARQAMRDDISTSLKPVIESWNKETQAIGKELGVNFAGLTELINNYVNTLREMRRLVGSYAQDLLNRITSSAPSRTLQKLREDLRAYVPEAIEKIKKLIEGLSTSTKQLIDQMGGVAENYRQIRDDVYKNLKIDELKAYFSNLAEDIRQYPIVQKIIQFFTNLKQNMPDVSVERLKATAANLNEQANQAAAETRKQVEIQAAALRDELLRNEDTKDIARFISEAYNRLAFYLSRLGPGEKVKGLYEWITQEFRDLTSGGGAMKQFLPSVKESNPEKGIYVIEGTVPGNFKSFDEIASKFQVDRLKQLKNSFTERAGAMAQDADYAVRDVLVNIQPSSLSKFRSPLSSTAVLAGDQHFVTFDDEEFDFAGECDYLLARDFENGEFTIFVSFERRQGRVARKSVTVEYLEHKVEVSYDNKVKIDNKDTELPWHSVNDETQDVILQVSRRDHSIIVKAIDGLTVDCDGYYHVCRITVPKRYHGKSGGLLGINDFESYNELTKPDRKRTTDVAEFAREWSTSASCAVRDNQAKKDAIQSGPLFEECESLLNSSSSPLRLCFHRLPPAPFLTMCLTDAKELSALNTDINRQKRGLCNSAAAYIEACDEQGVYLELPSQCVHCEVGGSTLTEDEMKRLEGNEVPNYADVIFVVEERKRMAWTKAQLPNLAQKLESDLKQQKYDVRFGVVGFNGEGVHYKPHFHTGQGEISLTLDAIKTAAGQLSFSDRERRRFQDPLVAVKFSADHFPFRAGTRKLLALFACEECGGLEVDYFDLQSELLQMSVSLQLITPEIIELSTPGAPEAIAVDASTVYGADSSEKPELRPQLVGPHDSCTVLTQETNGTVFSYTEKNQAAFTQLLVKKLVKSVEGPKCQICECQENDHAPRTVCFPCEIPRPASLTSDSTGFFNNPFVRLQKWQRKAQDTLNRGLAPMRLRV